MSAIHVVVGAAYCGITYLLGFKEASFGRVRHSHVYLLKRLRNLDSGTRVSDDLGTASLPWAGRPEKPVRSDSCRAPHSAPLHMRAAAASSPPADLCTLVCLEPCLKSLRAYPVLQMITKKEFKQIFAPASMHAIGHVAANLSFAAVAISLTHTVKTLEPAFNVVLSRVLLGNVTPLPVIGTLVPIMVRVLFRSHKRSRFRPIETWSP